MNRALPDYVNIYDNYLKYYPANTLQVGYLKPTNQPKDIL